MILNIRQCFLLIYNVKKNLFIFLSWTLRLAFWCWICSQASWRMSWCPAAWPARLVEAKVTTSTIRSTLCGVKVHQITEPVGLKVNLRRHKLPNILLLVKCLPGLSDELHALPPYHWYRPMLGLLWLGKSMYNCYSCSIGWCNRHISDLFPILSKRLKCWFSLFSHPDFYGAQWERLNRFSGSSICVYNCYRCSTGWCWRHNSDLFLIRKQ